MLRPAPRLNSASNTIPSVHLEPGDARLALGFFVSPGGRADFPQPRGGPLHTAGAEPGDYRGGGGRYYRLPFTSGEFNGTTDLRVVADVNVLASQGTPAATCVQVTTPEGRTFGLGFVTDSASPEQGAAVLYADSGAALPVLPGVYLGQDWLWRPAVLDRRPIRPNVRRTYVLELLRHGPGGSEDLIRVSMPGTDIPPMTAHLRSLKERVTVPGILFGHPTVQGAGEADWYGLAISTTGAGEPALPRHIGNRRQLFLDDWLIEKSENLQREPGKPVKDPHNPVLLPGKPWDAQRCDIYGNVTLDPQSGLLQMFYTGQSPSAPGSGKDRENVVCYAESGDGGHTWKKPDLTEHSYQGISPTNIVYQRDSLNVQGPFVLRDEHERDPARRYKLFVSDYNEGGRGTPNAAPGMDAAFSPDGRHWKESALNPTLPLLSDTAQSVFWDERIRRYVAYVRMRPKKTGRAVGRTESPDFEHWTPPELVFCPTRYQFYSMGVTPYEGAYIGTPWIVYNDKKDNSLPPPIMEAELAFSRDGWNWSRPFSGTPFLGVGPPGSQDEKQVRMASSMVVLEDRILCFYGMSPDAHISNMRVAIGLAVLRLDGFVALSAGEKEGLLITRPFGLEGSRLVLNAACAGEKGGSIQVAITDPEGRTLGSGASLPVTGDGLHLPVKWAGVDDLGQYRNKAVRLKITLRNARLYSFQFQNE